MRRQYDHIGQQKTNRTVSDYPPNTDNPAVVFATNGENSVAQRNLDSALVMGSKTHRFTKD